MPHDFFPAFQTFNGLRDYSVIMSMSGNYQINTSTCGWVASRLNSNVCIYCFRGLLDLRSLFCVFYKVVNFRSKFRMRVAFVLNPISDNTTWGVCFDDFLAWYLVFTLTSLKVECICIVLFFFPFFMPSLMVLL